MQQPESPSLPKFIPDKKMLWSRLVTMAKEDRVLHYAHAERAPAVLVRSVTDRVFARLKGSLPRVWDDQLTRAVIREFCDPDHIALPDADRYEDLLQQWQGGRSASIKDRPKGV